MCGLVGYLTAGFGGAESALETMLATLVNRGPDDFGVWRDREQGISLGHRRLSILDLSPAGHQPMVSFSQRYVVAFNGEIYNHQDLRASLDKFRAEGGADFIWRGHSDTETLLAGFEVWGIPSTIERSIGMFAIAVWDRERQTLTLVRDRIGEKPLYYGWQGQGDKACFLFGSELKALRAHPSFCSDVNRDAMCLYMRHNYIPAPHSIYQNIFKLAPGFSLTVSLREREPKLLAYWSLEQVAENGVASPFEGDVNKVVDGLEALLKDAVRQQMMADVPLGAFLSGGIDSSTVVAMMQTQSTRPVKTFTIGFNEESYNEALHAKAVARHLGTEHTEMYVTPQQALQVIPSLPSLYCEPFADSSQIPTFLVSQLARQNVTVSLSGDGGDELFGGYNRYVLAQKLWGKLSRLPVGARSLAASSIRAVSPSGWDRMIDPFQSMTPRSMRFANIGDKLHKGAEVLAARQIDDLYFGLLTHWNPLEIVLDGRDPSTLLNGGSPSLKGLDDIQRMMALDTMTYLPDDILVKVDRAAMGVSLESRIPFLDHRVVEFAWRIPQSLKLRDGVGKWILREVLYRHVPKELIERPKMGFGVPIDAWLRGPLKDWAESLLDEGRLRREGFFKPDPIRAKWAEHLSGKRNWQYLLWDVLMFQAWLENQRSE
jgi:asparagine synthase (glutamine-hydrolysing)